MANKLFEYDLSNMKNNDMKEFSHEGDSKILVVKYKDQFFAVSNKCTHYGAPLVNGVFNKGIVRCPWHGACFNVTTGDIEDFPGLDNLSCYKVEHIDNQKFRIIKKERKQLNKFNHNHVVIIGSGPCGLECSEKLRSQGFDGKITIITKDVNLPYDRPKLSKAMDVSIEAAQLRNKEFFNKNNITFMTGKIINHIDFKQHCIKFDENSIKYEKLLIATGGVPFVPNILGHDAKNIFTLRSFDDAKKIFAQISPNINVVTIGSSFIGMEVASYMVSKVSSLTVIDRFSVPFEKTFGTDVGNFIKDLHIQNGVKFKLETEVSEFIYGDEDKRITGIKLSNGENIPCDLCILGVGVRPETAFLNNFPGAEQLKFDKFGYLEVNEYMQTAISNVYAGGDIVKFPLFLQDNELVNIQHWQMAHKHGQIAALNMFSQQKVAIRSVPYFWTVQCGKSFRYVGYNQGYVETIFHSDDKKTKFVVYYIKNGLVKAALTFMRDPVASLIAEIMYTGKKLSKTEIQELEPLFEQEGYVENLQKILRANGDFTGSENGKYKITSQTYTVM